ncbi:hypothetical protein BDZ89DRAFT_1073008, partial [Hymenopellis radicata]
MPEPPGHQYLHIIGNVEVVSTGVKVPDTTPPSWLSEPYHAAFSQSENSRRHKQHRSDLQDSLTALFISEKETRLHAHEWVITALGLPRETEGISIPFMVNMLMEIYYLRVFRSEDPQAWLERYLNAAIKAHYNMKMQDSMTQRNTFPPISDTYEYNTFDGGSAGAVLETLDPEEYEEHELLPDRKGNKNEDEEDDKEEDDDEEDNDENEDDEDEDDEDY